MSTKFIELDSLKCYKDIKFGSSVDECKSILKLKAIKNLEYFYTILNKKYLVIDTFEFKDGRAFFLYDQLNTIDLLAIRTDLKYFKLLANHFTTIFGTPLIEDGNYYWYGNFLSYKLIRASKTKNISLSISGMERYW